MKYKVKAFGIVKDIIGEREIWMELGSKITVADLIATLHGKYPALNSLNALFVAVNREYAAPEKLLAENDEIALIPPVSGG